MAYRIEKTSSGADIVIDGFENGIAASPYEGISDIRNVDIISIPGEAGVDIKTQAIHQAPISGAAFTVLASNDTFTYNGSVPLKVGATIVLNTLTGGTGLATSTSYWVKTIPSPTTFTVTAAIPGIGGSVGGATVNVTLDGSGTFSTVNIALLTQIVANGQTFYGIDTNGRVWVYNSSSGVSTNWIYLGNTATAAVTPDYTTGIAFWNGYIVALYDGSSGYGLYTGTGTPAAFTIFKGLSSTTTHRTYTDKNNTLYWCDGSRIGSLLQLTTFDPTNSSTYTYSASALAIQPNDTAQCMTQLGTNLLVGGVFNQIYSWDRSSSGYTPLIVPENNPYRMVTLNSSGYVFAGNRGRIYVTNGANVQLFRKMPDHLSNTVQPFYTWGGADTNNNQLYFSITAFAYPNPNTALPYYGGIWSIDMDTNALRLVNQLSYGTYDGYVGEVTATIGGLGSSTASIPSSSFGIICSWQDSTSFSPNYGSDATPVVSNPAVSAVPYSNYESYVDTDMIPIGTYLNPTTDANVEFKLTVPLVSGEGVKLFYRQDLSQSFTAIAGGEFLIAGTLSGVVKVNFQKSQWLQIRCYTKSTNVTPSYTRLRELRIR